MSDMGGITSVTSCYVNSTETNFSRDINGNTSAS